MFKVGEDQTWLGNGLSILLLCNTRTQTNKESEYRFNVNKSVDKIIHDKVLFTE